MARSLRLAVAVCVVVSLVAACRTSQAEPTRFRIRPADGSLTFKATSRLVDADGRFRRFEGEVVVDPQDMGTARVRITVEAASIDTGIQRRDNHLRSEDFFHVERFPVIVFESQRVEAAGASLRVVGRLTVRGISRDVAIPVQVELTHDRLVARGEFVLNRRAYGIVYSSFLNPIGDAVRVAFDFRGRPG